MQLATPGCDVPLQALVMGGSLAYGLGDFSENSNDARDPAGHQTRDLSLSTCARFCQLSPSTYYIE